jgi:DNA ligase (NAD+)
MNGVTIEKTIFKNSSQFKDMIFVITGSFKEYKRTEVKELLEKKGGRVTSTVSSKTSFLIIGDNAGSKLEKARALNIKSINEDQLESFLN